MMRRTYMSRKATANNIERRDLFQNLNENCAPYDAFSIQNIKQTKRELSCVSTVNSLGVASSRVRKRKYVKRIVKDRGISNEDSLPQSTNLTPNKSLHVNKTPDPFDLLLMSSPIDSQKSKSQTSKLDVCYNTKKQGKKYTRRKPIKKLNTSSIESSESEKENSDIISDTTPNTSDIRTHKLVVEEEHNISPKCVDDSINNIVNNLSLLHKLKHKCSKDSNNKSLRKSKNRLTRNSGLLKSPLSSTPFKIKYREGGNSIYNFSPITSTGEDNHEKMCLNLDNDNTIYNDNSEMHLSIDKENKSDISTGNPQISMNCVPNYDLEHKASDVEVSPNNDFYSDVAHKSYQFTEDLAVGIPPNAEISLCQSENELFLGFPPDATVELKIPNKLFKQIRKTLYFNDSISKTDEIENGTDNKDKYLKANQQNNVSSYTAGYESRYENPDVETADNVFIHDSLHCCGENCVSSEDRESNVKNYSMDHNSTSSSSVQYESSDIEIVSTNEKVMVTHEDYLGCHHSLEKSYQHINPKSEQVFENEHQNNDSILDHDSTENIYQNSQSSECNLDNESIDHEDSNDSPLSESDGSFYDTCTSDQSSILHNEIKSEPIVVLQRMNDSLFHKYYDIMKSHESGSSDKSDSFNNSINDFFSIRGSSCANEKSNSDLKIDETRYLFNYDDCNDNNALSNDDSSFSNNEADKSISFVTTRRKNEVTNNSNISIFSNSYCSSSTDCNETVLSNKKELEKYGANEIQSNDNYTVTDLATDTHNKSEVQAAINFNKSNEDLPLKEPKVSCIATEGNHFRMVKENYVRPENIPVVTDNSETLKEWVNVEVSRMSVFDSKPGIILKPGKKWERSLSIYRRMTMMADQINQSILDDQLTKNKGRKYRQSVITTIEMQDLNGSLHNETINSRRSTFVSKPSRSTIRIVKDPDSSRLSLSNTSVFDDLKGFLNEECDDTIIELSKLSIADQSHEVTVLDNFHDTSNRITAARDYVLRRCNQTDSILFDECYPDAVLKNCHKIGEGVYGEVFLWRARDGCARVLKIIPIAGNIKVNGESQKDFHEVISEIVIAMELSALRAPIAEIDRHFDEGKDVEALDLHAIENATDVFNEVLAVRCVYGSYPSRLLDLWDLYDECKGSENDNPAILPPEQQYIVLELANAGQDLESYQFNNAEQAHALFLQVAYGLAVAEEAFQFEHRDLHWGNVLISPTDQKYATFVIRGRAFRVPRCGVRGAIIDYSLSRVALRLGCGDAAALYNDLAADESLFDALGDYQFEVYRLMRDKLGNDWKNFEPYTNILWLHYTVDKMITALRYKRTNTKIHKHYIDKLKGIKARILDYGSAAQFVLTDNEI